MHGAFFSCTFFASKLASFGPERNAECVFIRVADPSASGRIQILLKVGTGETLNTMIQFPPQKNLFFIVLIIQDEFIESDQDQGIFLKVGSGFS